MCPGMIAHSSSETFPPPLRLPLKIVRPEQVAEAAGGSNALAPMGGAKVAIRPVVALFVPKGASGLAKPKPNAEVSCLGAD